jgi:SAM-dependent methyltransferase
MNYDNADAAGAGTAGANDYHILAQNLMRQGRAREALNLMLQAASLAPPSPALLLDTAAVQQALGLIPEATESYRKCSGLLPADGYVRELHTQSLMEQWLSALVRRRIGREASKSYSAKVYSGFFRTYLSGRNILDIGYRGGFGEAEPIVKQALGIDLDYPGYDGVRLPFADGSQDAVYSSHCLEHIPNLSQVIQDWHRVVRVGGYIVTVVPHQFLYERKKTLPSSHPNHFHFFTPAKLLAAFEESLPPNSYRVRHLMDNDLCYDYAINPSTHPVGCYEIELVVEKIETPAWNLTE